MGAPPAPTELLPVLEISQQHRARNQVCTKLALPERGKEWEKKENKTEEGDGKRDTGKERKNRLMRMKNKVRKTKGKEELKKIIR